LVTIVYVGYGLRKSLVEASMWIRDKVDPGFTLKFFNVSEVDQGLIDPGKYVESLRVADAILLDIRGGDNVYRYTREALQKTRARAIVVLVGGSPEVMSWTRLGRFTMRYLEKRGGKPVDYGTVTRIMHAVEALGSIFPAGVLRDARNYALIMKYYSNLVFENALNMLLLIMRDYLGFKLDTKISEPWELPAMGIIDFHTGKVYTDTESYLGDYEYKDRPLIGILFYGGHHYDQSVVAARAIAERLESMGFGVIPVFSGDLRYYLAIVKFLTKRAEPLVDLVIDLLWFRLAGGPLGGDHGKTLAALRLLNTPILHGIHLSTVTIDEWLKRDRIPPVETITTVILPELDGRVEPIVTHGRVLVDFSGYKVDEYRFLEDRVEKLCKRASKWVALRRKPNSEKRVAIVIYAYPPGLENLGKASYLDVFTSLHKLLLEMKQRGYSIPSVEPDELRELLLSAYMAYLEGKPVKHSVIISGGDYMKLFSKLPAGSRGEVEKTWGSVEGLTEIIIPGVVLGNVFIGIQPPRGKHGTDAKLYHSRETPPTHDYIAFYKWIEEVFNADAVVHLGTHGTLEFLPGKEVGLTSECYPDALIGSLPNIYVYTAINASEASIAKRRSYAVIVNHAPPPYMHGELPAEVAEIERLIREYYDIKQFDPVKAAAVEREVLGKASKLGLSGSLDEVLERINEYRSTPIPRGLHVLGEGLDENALLEYLLLVSRYDRSSVKSLYRIVAEALGFSYDEVLEGRAFELYRIVESKARSIISGTILEGRRIDDVLREASLTRINRQDVEKTISYLRDVAERTRSSSEVEQVIRALNGRFIEPGPGGDPVRNPEVYPTGRNIYQLDPANIPTSIAWERGRRIAEEILERYLRENGRYPRLVSIVLWAFETINTGGETLATVFHLLGVKPVWKSSYIREIEVIPLEELGRPRIDVVVTMCGIFRDTFYNIVELLDRAFKTVASLDEPLDKNYVRANAVKLGTERIYGPPPDKYATELTAMIESSRWSSEADLVQAYLESMRYYYGEGEYGTPRHDLFKEILRNVDVVAQVRDTVEYDIIDLDHYYEFLGGLARSVKELKGENPLVLVADSTRERVRVENIADAIGRGVVMRLTNPAWIKEMLKYKHHGGEKIASRVENLLGLAALTGAVENWAWNRVAEKLVLDEETRTLITENNPWAMSKIIDKLLEASRRGYWRADTETIRELENIKKSVEKHIEDLRETMHNKYGSIPS